MLSQHEACCSQASALSLAGYDSFCNDQLLIPARLDMLGAFDADEVVMVFLAAFSAAPLVKPVGSDAAAPIIHQLK